MSTPSDAFETLRDCRNLYLKHLGALLQDNGSLGGGAIQVIQEAAGAYFDEMVASNRRGSFQDEAGGLTASRITLVGEEDLELGIRLDNLTARLFGSAGETLWKLHLRFVTLLNRPDLSKNDNPLGPRGVVLGIERMLERAGAVSLDKKLDLLDALADHLNDGLPALYAELEAFLSGAGVTAAQAGIITSPEAPKKGQNSASTADNASNGSLLALQQALLARLPAGNGLTMGTGFAGAPGFPAPQSGTMPNSTAGGAAAALLSQGALERLIFRLNELDRQRPVAAAAPISGAPSLENLIPGLFESGPETAAAHAPINSSALGIPAAAPEGLAIDTLATIFEAMFANPELPDALKAIISSLQITLLKVAMQDATLFTDTAHPARQLIDRMGTAMLGLPRDVPARHPICVRLGEIASQLRTAYHGDNAILRTALDEVNALIEARALQIIQAADAYLPMLHQLDRRDESSVQVGQVIDQLLSRPLPKEIRNFIDQTWRRVMLRNALQGGAESPEWLADKAAIDGLLWSFEPKPALDDRKLLAGKLPAILKRLKAGMEAVGLAPAAQTAFLDTCFTLQTAALRGQNPLPASAGDDPLPARSPMAPLTATPVAGEIEAGGRILRTLDFAAGQAPAGRSIAGQPGDWMIIRDELEASQVAMLCHRSPLGQRTLFFNPDSGLALAIHPAILEKQLRDGSARACGGDSLFEAAARQALGQQSPR